MSTGVKVEQNGETYDDIEFLSAPTRVSRGKGKSGRAVVFATNEQMKALRAAYAESSYIQGNKLRQLADDIGLTEKWISLWFGRQRRKTRDTVKYGAEKRFTDVKQEEEPATASAPVRSRKPRKSKARIDDSDDEARSDADDGQPMIKKEQEEPTTTPSKKQPTLRIRLPPLKRPVADPDPHSEVMMVVDPQPAADTAASQPSASTSRLHSGSPIDFGEAPIPESSDPPPQARFANGSAPRPPSEQATPTRPSYQSFYDKGTYVPVFLPEPPDRLGSPVNIPSSPSESGSDSSDFETAPSLLASNPHARALHAGAPVPAEVAARPAYQMTDPARLRELYADMYSRPAPAPLDVTAPPSKRARVAYAHLAKYPAMGSAEKSESVEGNVKQEPTEEFVFPASISAAGQPFPYSLGSLPAPLPVEGEGIEEVHDSDALRNKANNPAAWELSDEPQILEYPDAATPPPPSLFPLFPASQTHAPHAVARAEAPALRPANFDTARHQRVAEDGNAWRPAEYAPPRVPATMTLPDGQVDEDSPAALLKHLDVLRAMTPNDADAPTVREEYITDREEILRRLLDPDLAERDPIQAAMGLVFLARVGMQDYL
ncbi:hypothetical protein BD626DRAFT_479002 [Schizophyllum amplum]|uniref:Homeobox domain-containing protein n=1 Tax=Schizophyllum amplum TaxID=97359 RepID=A0A550CRT8_9AGAR|nr:hypothetical protein BD626DRAFT_479002 [Auriculariopsis ampla]